MDDKSEPEPGKLISPARIGAAAGESEPSKRLLVTDRRTGIRFLVDTGADVSVLPLNRRRDAYHRPSVIRCEWHKNYNTWREEIDAGSRFTARLCMDIRRGRCDSANHRKRFFVRVQPAAAFARTQARGCYNRPQSTREGGKDKRNLRHDSRLEKSFSRHIKTAHRGDTSGQIQRTAAPDSTPHLNEGTTVYGPCTTTPARKIAPR